MGFLDKIPGLYDFVVGAGIPGIVLLVLAALISWLIKTVPEIRKERRKAKTVLLWIEIEAKIARDQLVLFDEAFRTRKHQEIDAYAAAGKPYRMITAVSNQPNEYAEWKDYIVSYPVHIVEATAIYIELDVMIDGLLQKMETESFERIDPIRQKATIDVFMTLCQQKAQAIDSLLSGIESYKRTGR
jgi:hypothetical protein